MFCERDFNRMQASGAWRVPIADAGAFPIVNDANIAA
jgi:hypothetical protein